ncbi:MAG: Ig-like domain-containing protein, partial [Bacillota bacterium]|nr:Ig-like domain-containing protein [Bacillota bacterium]
TGNITIDIGGQYRSVDIGETIQLTPTTSDATDITWKSSNEAVATVDENGVVTGKKLGQVRITAATSTGNKDQAYVSVGFYNGIDVKYSSGPADSNGKLGYGEIDWEFVKETGVDFAIIRAGYGLYGPDSDPYFVENIKGAVENDIDVLVSYDSYADTEEEAVADAKYLVNYMNTNVADYVGELDLPIVYNLFKSNVEDVTTLKQVSLAFDKEMEAAGYETIIEHGKTKMSAMELKEITDADIGLYMIYKPYYPDYSARMYAMNNGVRYDADIWQYRGDAYFGNDGIGKETTMAAMYMDSIDLDEDPVEPEEPAEPSDPKDPENENAADENDSSIDTSDSFNMTGCIMVMLISLIIMAAIGRRRSDC